MKYDFETRVNRKGCGNIKDLWFTPQIIKDKGLPSYSGAEFEFKTAPCVIDAMKACADNGLFGFTVADDEYREKIVWWLSNVRQVQIEKDWILPMQGTIFSIASAIRLFVRDRGHMILMTPEYNRYDQAVRRLHCAPSVFVERKTVNGRFVPDYEALEAAFADPDAKLFVFSNPNNPSGQALYEEDLRKILTLSRKYNIPVVCDEIFADISLNGKDVPCLAELAEDNDLVISLTSLGKTFSFTGVNHANAIIRNKALKDAFEKQRTADHFGSIDPMAFAALKGGYTPEGEAWLEELKQILITNTKAFVQFFSQWDGITVTVPDAGYVLWVDLEGLGMNEEQLHEFLIQKAYFSCDAGNEYYGKESNVRICTAVPPSCVKQSIALLQQAFEEAGFKKNA